MVELSIGHEVVLIDFLQLFEQILLANDQADHLRSHILPYLFHHAFKSYLAVLVIIQLRYFFADLLVRQGGDFPTALQYLDAFPNEEYLSRDLLTDDGERDEFAVNGEYVPPGHLYVLTVLLETGVLLLLYNLMYEVLSIGVDQLSMYDPSHSLIHEYLLAGLQDGVDPGSQPLTAPVVGLPEYIDDDPSSILLHDYPRQNRPQLFHYDLESHCLGSDVTDSEVFAAEEVPLYPQYDILVFL